MFFKCSIAVISLMSFGLINQAFAEAPELCKVIAVASISPNIKGMQVLINVTTEDSNYADVLYFTKPTTTINGLPCDGKQAYNISATPIMIEENSISTNNNMPIGLCKLRAGPVILSPGNSVAVAFPNDFDCPN